MKKLMMFLGILFVGTIVSSFAPAVWTPVRLYYDWDHDGYHCRTAFANSEYKYNIMLLDNYSTTTLGKESAALDKDMHHH